MNNLTNTQKLLIVIFAVVLVISSGCMKKTGNDASGMKSQQNTTEKDMEPRGMPTTENLGSQDWKEAVIKGDYQEVDLKIYASGNSPRVIIAKKNILLRINIYYDVSHAMQIIFPDFGIEKRLLPGSLDLIEILPAQEGTFKFGCPMDDMDMCSGELIVK